MSKENDSINRRMFVTAAGSSLLVGLAGCTSGGSESEGTPQGGTKQPDDSTAQGGNKDTESGSESGSESESEETETATPEETETATPEETETATPEETETATPEPETEAVTVEEHELVEAEYGGTAEIHGKVTNTSGGELSYMEVTGRLYDADDVRLGEALWNASDAPADETFKFEAFSTVDYADVERYEVVTDSSNY
ncbi:prolyl-tRNA synthetase [Halogranum amylolyticum]|uniref:Prolyl-tRNA synthetase n=1 Tax=Halogranum amylolyticum TaxID=660520 RepID=A0A1H8VPZ4_9EURY|nr:FxLYD domain-containing protein [Halogranum amylolyticum]SEP17370.1 prolyl-tRNA synthetase [Halogranum amylolyticum]